MFFGFLAYSFFAYPSSIDTPKHWLKYNLPRAIWRQLPRNYVRREKIEGFFVSRRRRHRAWRSIVFSLKSGERHSSSLLYVCLIMIALAQDRGAGSPSVAPVKLEARRWVVFCLHLTWSGLSPRVPLIIVGCEKLVSFSFSYTHLFAPTLHRFIFDLIHARPVRSMCCLYRPAYQVDEIQSKQLFAHVQNLCKFIRAFC